MACGNWMERGVTWDNVARDDGTGDNESTISFADNLEGSVWYNVNVTMAVRDALENREPCLGIQSAFPP